MDPLFLYISVFNEKKTCLDLDNKLGIAATVLRSVTDVFYMLHIILQFRTGFMGPSSPACGRGVLVGDPSEIAKRYMTSYFLIDILAVLPLPQVYIFIYALLQHLLCRCGILFSFYETLISFFGHLY